MESTSLLLNTNHRPCHPECNTTSKFCLARDRTWWTKLSLLRSLAECENGEQKKFIILLTKHRAWRCSGTVFSDWMLAMIASIVAPPKVMPLTGNDENFAFSELEMKSKKNMKLTMKTTMKMVMGATMMRSGEERRSNGAETQLVKRVEWGRSLGSLPFPPSSPFSHSPLAAKNESLCRLIKWGREKSERKSRC